jgi:hypothetical protein
MFYNQKTPDMTKNKFLLFLLLLFGSFRLMAQSPQVVMQNLTNALPGDITVGVDMLGFTGSNGSIQSIQFTIEFDDALLNFQGLTNVNSNFGGWVVPTSGHASPITLSWTNTTGQNIDTKVFDLKFHYAGGFNGNVNFVTSGCEVSRNLSPMTNVTYSNGSVTQTSPVATVDMNPSPQYASNYSNVTVPVNMNGLGSSPFSAFMYKIKYDPSRLNLLGVANVSSSFATTINYAANASTKEITITWNGAPTTINGHAFDLKFQYLGGGSTPLEFKSGCEITNALTMTPFPATYSNGEVTTASGSTLSLPTLAKDLNSATYSVPVTLVFPDAPGAHVGTVELKIGYDPTILAFQGQSITPGSGTLLATGTTPTVSATGSVITVSWAKSTNTSDVSGTLLNLQFKNIKTGTSALTFNGGTTVTQTNLSNVVLGYTNGSVTSTWQISPTSASVCSGGNGTFTVSSASPSGMQWQISTNGGTSWSDITNGGTNPTYGGATTNTLTVTNAQYNAGGYKFRCMNTVTLVPSDAATFTVNQASVSVGPSNQSVAVGGNASFGVTASCATSYLWYVSTNSGGSWTALTNTGVYTNVATATMNITGATAGMDQYQYKCIVQPGGASSSAATLTILPANITVQPSNQSIAVGANASFSLTATGATTYAWQVSTDGGSSWNPLSNGGVYTNVTTNSMNITGATAGMDQYKYKCIVQPGNVNSNSATLTILAANITVQPVDQTIAAGGNASFSLTATGATGYVWQVSTDGGSSWTPLTNTGVYTNVTTNSMNITGAPYSMNTYKYKCIVQPGNVNSNSATLTVQQAQITLQPSDASVYPNEKATFAITATGATSYLWYESTDGGSTFLPLSASSIYEDVTTNTLVVWPPASMDGYKYKCVVQPGNVSSNAATLTVVGTFSVSGILKYANTTGAARPITNSTIYLKSPDGLTTFATTTTDGSGNFTFSSVANGSYKLYASTSKPWVGSAITLADYALVRNFVNTGTPALTGIILLAANVNNVGGVTLADYGLIRNYVNTSSLGGWNPNPPVWIFGTTDVTISNASQTNMVVLGILTGDVNTSYTPPL